MTELLKGKRMEKGIWFGPEKKKTLITLASELVEAEKRLGGDRKSKRHWKGKWLIKEEIAVKKYHGSLEELVPLRGQTPYSEKGGMH
jgi:hypothetical protein